MSPTRTEYPQGVPSWVDLGTPDVSKAVEFYGPLFGWTLEDTDDPEAFGGYRNFLVGEDRVAGVGPLMVEGQPPAWSVYLAADDAQAVAAAVKEAGGNVVQEPMQVGDFGAMALFTDPTGAFFGVWQAGSHPGAERVNEHGANTWNECMTRNPDAAKEFYAAVFGYTYSEMPAEAAPEGGYSMFEVDGAVSGGIAAIGEQHPPDVPAHWFTTFGHDDPDAAATQVAKLGGTVLAEPFDVPGVGRMAIVTDPWGAAFAVARIERPGE